MPVLSLAGDEGIANHISVETQEFVIETIRELIEDLGSRYVKPRKPDRLRVLGVCAPGEVHYLAGC
jgi:hypothetical protein